MNEPKNNKTILTDSHLHTDFSADSSSPMEEMVNQAIKLGLFSICFTEHMDYGFPPENGREFVFDISDYLERISTLRAKVNSISGYYNKPSMSYTDNTDANKSKQILKIRQGIELGLKPELAECHNKLTNKYPFDFIIGSTHLVNGKDPYYNSFWENISEKQGICDYYETTLKNILSNTDFDVYGHIDYILRYTPFMKQLVKNKKNTEKYYNDCISYTGELITEILKKLIENGKGIEINSSGLKYGLRYPHPHTWVLKRYRELGGEIITVGSDAHSPNQMAYGFSDIFKILINCGFSYYAVYENRTPFFIKL